MQKIKDFICWPREISQKHKQKGPISGPLSFRIYGYY